MNILSTWITGILLLVLVFLLVRNASQTNQVITALSNAQNSAIRTLQGNA